MPEALHYGYWTFNGKNGLAGVPGDADNPAVLHEDFIVDALRTSRIAASQFCRLFPTLLPDEQDRLLDILERRPQAKFLITDPQAFLDQVQTRECRAGVHVRKPTP